MMLTPPLCVGLLEGNVKLSRVFAVLWLRKTLYGNALFKDEVDLGLGAGE